MNIIGILVAIVGILGIILMLIGFLSTTDDPKGINNTAVVGIVLVAAAAIALAVTTTLVGLGELDVSQVPDLSANYASMAPIRQGDGICLFGAEPDELGNCPPIGDYIQIKIIVGLVILLCFLVWNTGRSRKIGPNLNGT